ncbi:hypothetical protein EJB05_05209 [Eragrostis curvula]|uniref:Uncharacterized protein n=1 Tax=Eragrostis curvula TaxID=38414 RepID=A0A5J9WCH9_9POAL|nr:hypothetical protein EJB05_05209 [Eragrostis curvula]
MMVYPLMKKGASFTVGFGVQDQRLYSCVPRKIRRDLQGTRTWRLLGCQPAFTTPICGGATVCGG